MKRQTALFIAIMALAAGRAHAATFVMTPDDDWSIIESAQAGDTVEIAPGTYQFRVYLRNAGTAAAPIIIRAQDPGNPPVWDLIGDEAHRVSSWPGSYSGGDLGRGCWQAGPDAAFYEISGIVFRNCRDASSAGFRAVNSGPITLRDCLFETSTNGLTGTSEDLTVEHCEFRQNGQTWEGGAMTHNIYIYGGKFTMRYSYSHDSHEGQLFHIRAAQTLLEYNWFARPSSYVGDIMTCNYLCGGTSYEQHMTLLGNVIIQGAPLNGSQIIVLFHDEATPPSAMYLNLYHNTIIGTPRNPGQTHALVNMRNESVPTHAVISNNIIYQVGAVSRQENPALSNWSVSGTNNWVSAGTTIAGLAETIEGVDPGFLDPAAGDLRLQPGSAAENAADTTVPMLPTAEFYRDEALPMYFLLRNSATEPGAFEIGTGVTVYGPYGPLSDTELNDDTDSEENDPGGTDDTGENSDTAGDADTDGDADGDTGENSDNNNDSDDNGAASNADGCSCRTTTARGHFSLLTLLMRLL